MMDSCLDFSLKTPSCVNVIVDFKRLSISELIRISTFESGEMLLK